MISHRHQQLYKVIKHNKPISIVEVGTYNGINALHLITWASKYAPEGTVIKYYGFDLFEDGTPELDEAEFNAKERVAMCQVEYTLNTYRERNQVNFDFELYKGNTKETLAVDGPWKDADFAFIDGGHSVETIASDYENLKGCKVIAFDDFYIKNDDGCPDIEKVGCNSLLKSLGSHVILPLRDKVKGGGYVAMALTPIHSSPFPVQFEVKTKNCVDNSEILNNIEYATRIERKWTPTCKQHTAKGIIVAAGPSYLEDIDEIRELSNTPGNYVFCVKTNYKSLLEHNVNIHGVVLLDPRGHVKDFLDPIKDDIYYYVATMCHPSTTSLFDDVKNAYFWNALVGAGEQEYIGKLIVEEKRNVASTMIVGGSTAAMRALFVAYTMGFRSFILYGYDSCFWTPQNMEHVDAMGQPYFWNVAVNGKKYLTSLQLYSQAQEFAKLLEGLSTANTFDIEVRGRGIIKDTYDCMPRRIKTFEDFINAGN